MWVDGRLVAHYHAWVLTPWSEDDEEYFEDDDERFEALRRDDLFGHGFCIWIRREFQSELSRMTPDFIWCAAANCREFLRDSRQLQRPAIVHTRWIDGSVYADIWASKILSEVAQFGFEKLSLRIEQSQLVPIRYNL